MGKLGSIAGTWRGANDLKSSSMRFDATRVFREELDSRSIFAVNAISLTGILLLSINGLSKRGRPLPRVRFSLEMVALEDGRNAHPARLNAFSTSLGVASSQ